MSQVDLREYKVEARSTDLFGRVQCQARDQRFLVDGPVQNGCPGEAVTPAEAFLAGVAACGVELLQVLAQQQQVALRGVTVEIAGVIDRGNPVRTDLTLFNEVRLHFQLAGVTLAQGIDLVERFKRR